MKYDIICNGDSWTFGCEIVHPDLEKKYGGPNIHPGTYDYFSENNEYRMERIWSTYIKEFIDCNTVNISWPADDNNTILSRTIDYITRTYLIPKKSTKNVIVIVGWTSPERNSFWYKDDKIDWHFRLWPNVPHFNAKPQEEFWKLYIQYLWNKEEYIPRFIMNNLQLQNFCKANDIKLLMYNSFYQVAKETVDKWTDLNVKLELESMKVYQYKAYHESQAVQEVQHDWGKIWELINSTIFYKKDLPENTFNSYIKNTCSNPYIGLHPSPEGHYEWAKELARYLEQNNYLKRDII